MTGRATTDSLIALAVAFGWCAAVVAQSAGPDDERGRRMLAGDWVPEDPHRIDFEQLPRVPSKHVVVSDVRAQGGVNQHNYLAHHAGRFWVMWSDGPGVEDRVGQRVKFASSRDGVHWSEAAFLTPPPPGSDEGSEFYGTRSSEGFRYISRGLWEREGELLALVSLDEAAGFFGPSLALRAFRLDVTDETWEDLGVVADDTINNFPPKRLPTGEWMMSRRPHDYKRAGVHFLVGGTAALDRWTSYPVIGSTGELFAEEPFWWVLPDGRLMALFRDNRRSGYLYRSHSTDDGRTWTRPVRTDFPDATSKVNGIRLSDGRYVLVSNPNPRRRDPLVLSISDDGEVFHTMGYLVGGRRVDYPHAIEHDGHLLIAFSGGKQSVEVLRIRIADLERVRLSSRTGEPPAPAAPGRRLDLRRWKLTLPVETDRPGRPDEVRLPELESFVDRRFFFLDQETGGVVFRAHCGGSTTKSSSYPRCELREMDDRGDSPAAWGTDDGGTHTMTMRAAITRVPPVKSHVVCAQIHDAEGDVIMVRLEGKKLFVERDSLDDVSLDPDYELGRPFELKVEAGDGRIRVWHDGRLGMDWKQSRTGCYFKAGCYTQSNPSRGDAADSFGEVVVYRLEVEHRERS